MIQTSTNRYIEWLAEDPSPREEASDKLMAPIVPELEKIIEDQVCHNFKDIWVQNIDKIIISIANEIL